MLINKKQYTFATLRIVKSEEMIKLEQKSILENFLLKKYKRSRFWLPIFFDFIIIVLPFLYIGVELSIYNIAFLGILSIVANFLLVKVLNTYYEKRFKENDIIMQDNLKPYVIEQLKDALQKTVEEEIKKEEINNYKIVYFGIQSTPYCYEIPIQYTEK